MLVVTQAMMLLAFLTDDLTLTGWSTVNRSVTSSVNQELDFSTKSHINKKVTACYHRCHGTRAASKCPPATLTARIARLSERQGARSALNSPLIECRVCVVVVLADSMLATRLAGFGNAIRCGGAVKLLHVAREVVPVVLNRPVIAKIGVAQRGRGFVVCCVAGAVPFGHAVQAACRDPGHDAAARRAHLSGVTCQADT